MRTPTSFVSAPSPERFPAGAQAAGTVAVRTGLPGATTAAVYIGRLYWLERKAPNRPHGGGLKAPQGSPIGLVRHSPIL